MIGGLIFKRIASGPGEAMQIFGRVFSSVSEFYKDLNPSTLSGAVDVVVVEDVQSGRLICSPFHVRFGKLQVLRPSEKKVEIEVNGRAVPEISMKIGLAGETFFVLPVDGPVPSEYQTSPLPLPIQADPQATALPAITLTSPVKQPAEPLSDSELSFSTKTAQKKSPKVASNGGALSDSELDAAGPSTQAQAADANGGGVEDEWTWKWGDLPEREHEHVTAVPDGNLSEQVSIPTETERKEIAELESMLLGQKSNPSESQQEPSKNVIEEQLIQIKSYLSRKETIKLMYERLQSIVEEGVEEVELCLLKLEPEMGIKESELIMLKDVNEKFKTVTWDDFEADPESMIASTLICIFGASTKWYNYPL